MTDLIEQLRDKAENDDGVAGYRLQSSDLMKEAADEIERLRNPWQDISTAPKDGTEFWGYSQDVHHGTSLKSFISRCAWHEDAGFCTDELRDPTHWCPLETLVPPQSQKEGE